MLQYSKISSLRQPKTEERNILQDWIDTTTRENRAGFLGQDLRGSELQPSVYQAARRKDLAILSDSHGEDDFFTKLITGPLLRAFHRVREYASVCMSIKTPFPQKLTCVPKRILPVRDDPENIPIDNLIPGMHHYDDERVGAVTHLLGTVLSSLAPLISIIALSFVTNDNARLGLICAFTLFFSLCLAVATKARRVEIFAATAA